MEKQWKRNSRRVFALVTWPVALCFAREAPSSAGGQSRSADQAEELGLAALWLVPSSLIV